MAEYDCCDRYFGFNPKREKKRCRAFSYSANEKKINHTYLQYRHCMKPMPLELSLLQRTQYFSSIRQIIHHRLFHRQSGFDQTLLTWQMASATVYCHCTGVSCQGSIGEKHVSLGMCIREIENWVAHGDGQEEIEEKRNEKIKYRQILLQTYGGP